METDSNGTSRVCEYVWGPDLSGSFQGAGGIGGLLAVSFGGAYYFPFYDQIGNVLGYADETGAVAAAYDYDAFGNILSSSGPMASFFRHRFSTKLLDPDTGLYYYGYRWYSPALGRWLSLDPIEEEGGANLYVFANNTALLHFDSLGAKCTPVSDPTPAPPYFWRVLKFEMDDKIKPSGGMYLLTGVHVVWGLKGRVVCCCGGQTVEKITMKTVERYIDLNQYSLQTIGLNPLAPGLLGVPNVTSLQNALSELLASGTETLIGIIDSLFLSPEAIENLRAALKNAAPKSLDSGTWPNNPCQ